MSRRPLRKIAAPLLATLALVACDKKEDDVTPTLRVDPPAGATAPGAAPAAAKKLPLDQEFLSKTKLVKLHYPRDFTAKPNETGNITYVEPKSSSRVDTDSLVAVSTIPDPVTTDLKEFVRIVMGARAKKLPKYALEKEGASKCASLDGIESVFTYIEASIAKRGRACTFIRNGHGFTYTYYVLESRRAADEPILRAIVDATEMLDGP